MTRAKHGLIIVGSYDNIKNHKTWKSIYDELNKDNHVFTNVEDLEEYAIN
jgi:superfamily I DNA and/or RNA helicase